MNLTTKYVLGGVVLVVIGLILFLQNTPSEQQMSDTKSQPEEQVPLASGAAGVYADYSPDRVASATSKDILLFFHATWCEECHELNKNINEHLNEIPGDVVILKIDYDTSTELKRKYGVTRQYTLVQVDSEGNMIKKFGGRPTLEKVLTNIQ